MHTYTCQATFVKHARREYSQLLIYTCTSCTSLYNIYNLQSQTKWSNVIAHVFLLCMTWLYSRTSPYRHLSNIDTSLIRTVHLVPGKCPYILCKNNLLLYGPSIIRTTDVGFKFFLRWHRSKEHFKRNCLLSSHLCQVDPACSSSPGGYSLEFLVGVCRPHL